MTEHERKALLAQHDIELTWLDGFAPVQAEGKVDGHDFYFRSRGLRWEFWIGPAWRDTSFTIGGTYGMAPFTASHMNLDVAAHFIIAGVLAFRDIGFPEVEENVGIERSDGSSSPAGERTPDPSIGARASLPDDQRE